jgi:hypothetical protein
VPDSVPSEPARTAFEVEVVLRQLLEHVLDGAQLIDVECEVLEGDADLLRDQVLVGHRLELLGGNRPVRDGVGVRP